MASRLPPISLVVGLPAGAASQRSIQALNQKFGARTEESLPLINGYTIQVPPDQLDTYLASLPENATVMRNEPFHRDVSARSRSGDSLESPGPNPYDNMQDPPPPPIHPLGWDEVRKSGLDGSGITLAVVDSGLSPHADFGNRLKAFKNFSWQGSSGPGDDYGHGTHVAGIAGGDGVSYDGVAPKVDLVGARITSPAEAIKAIDWVIANKETYSIDILNLSLGSSALLPGHKDPFAQAAQRAIDAGILTVVAAGNEGDGGRKPGSISTPGILQDAITVGAYNNGYTEELDDDTMWGNSSLGPSRPDNLAKPDLVAPGVGVVAASAEGSELRKLRPHWSGYHIDSGTSMAAPMVGGALALMLQANAKLTQAQAKKILQQTALPMAGVDVYAQGSGRLNLLAAVDQARLESTSA